MTAAAPGSHGMGLPLHSQRQPVPEAASLIERPDVPALGFAARVSGYRR